MLFKLSFSLLVLGTNALENNNVDNMRVRELKKLLRERDEPCIGCIERSDFVAKVKSVLLRETPEAQREAERRWKKAELVKEQKQDALARAAAEAEDEIQNAIRSTKAAKKVDILKKSILTEDGKTLQSATVKTLLNAYRAVEDTLSDFSVP